MPPVSDSSWGEWHYFNVATGSKEWWYVTFLVGGEVLRGRWGGQLLLSHRRPDGGYDRYTARFPSSAVTLDTTRADLRLGDNTVRQRDGIYFVRATAIGPAGTVSLTLRVVPERNRYFPPVDLREGEYISGYVVPALSARARGTICVGTSCRTIGDAPAYHDHNWGVWRNVTWDWGAARGRSFNLLYGAVYVPGDTLFTSASGAPRIFVALVDSLGVRQILRARRVEYAGTLGAHSGVRAPASFRFLAAREEDTLLVTARITDVQASSMTAAGMDRSFLQMRGAFTLEGTVTGQPVRDEGEGFFETYVGGER
jgi:hypothetical protein